MIVLMFDRQTGRRSIEFIGADNSVEETVDCLAITDMVIDWVRKNNPRGLERFAKTVIRQLTSAMRKVD